MKKISIFAIFGVIALMTSCGEDAIQGDQLKLEGLTKTMKAVDLPTKIIDKMISDTSMTLTPNDIPQTRNDLGSMRTVVKIFNGSDHAGLSVPGFGGLTLGKDETNMNVYYVELKLLTQ